MTTANYLAANKKQIQANYTDAVNNRLFWGENGQAVKMEPDQYLTTTAKHITKWCGGEYEANLSALTRAIR